MPLHPVLKQIVEQTKKAKLPPLRMQPLEDVRKAFFRLRLLAGETESVLKIQNQTIPGPGGNLAIRLYYPIKAPDLPILLYFHPGGFIKGDLDSHDPICRKLANRTKALVVSVKYRLAPEEHFPAPIQDGYAALNWVFNNAKEINADAEKIAVGGESSGGNIAAVLTHLSKQKKGPHISCQALIYPILDFTYSLPSHAEFAKGFLSEEDTLMWYRELYVEKTQDLKHPYLSPYWAKDFSNLPPGIIITAEFDPLRDEAEKYGEKLQKAGVETILIRYEGMTHGFFQMPGIIDTAEKAISVVSENIRKIFTVDETP